jgi:hypothetical protein
VAIVCSNFGALGVIIAADLTVNELTLSRVGAASRLRLNSEPRRLPRGCYALRLVVWPRDLVRVIAGSPELDSRHPTLLHRNIDKFLSNWPESLSPF